MHNCKDQFCSTKNRTVTCFSVHLDYTSHIGDICKIAQKGFPLILLLFDIYMGYLLIYCMYIYAIHLKKCLEFEHNKI